MKNGRNDKDPSTEKRFYIESHSFESSFGSDPRKAVFKTQTFEHVIRFEKELLLEAPNKVLYFLEGSLGWKYVSIFIDYSYGIV